MKNSVKILALITILFVLPCLLHAQLKLPVANGFTSDIKKIIEDYPNRFINLMGEIKIQHEQTTEYNCRIRINGAEEATVTRYSSKRDGVVSWEAVMITTDDFEAAKKKYKYYYTQLNNMAVTLGNARFRLRGDYETPSEEHKFNSVFFGFDPTAADIKKIKVELVLQYKAPMDWQVKIMVYDKEREDSEQGRVDE
jgi:hypothetical protein